MFRIAIAIVALALSAGNLRAQPVAYVDDVVVYGDVPKQSARTLVIQAVDRAGFRAVFRGEDGEPCRASTACLRQRAGRLSARVALTVVVLALTREVSLALSIVDLQRKTAWKYTVDQLELSPGPTSLADGIRAAAAGGSLTRQRSRGPLPWLATGAAIALAAGGAWAYLEARARRSEFLANHVDANGDLVGISQNDAMRMESDAQNLALLGAVLWTGAVASGLGAGILFARSRTEQAVPAGLVITGRF